MFPPEPHPLACGKIDAQRLQRVIPSCIPTMEVMIQVGSVLQLITSVYTSCRLSKLSFFCYSQLEGSGNWPMDDLAIEKTKTAFLIQIAEKYAKLLLETLHTSKPQSLNKFLQMKILSAFRPLRE